MNNCNLVFQNNLFKAILMTPDPNLKQSAAWGLSFPRYDAGMGVKFINNTCESNDIALNFGDDDGTNESDITMIGTTLVKSTEGDQSLTFHSIDAGGWGSTVHNVRLIDTTFANGASPTPYLEGTGAKDISFGYTLSVSVVDSHGNSIAGAAVSITDPKGNLVYGTTDRNGLIAIIPLITTTYSVPKSGNNSNPTVTNTQNYTVQATSGSLSGSLAVTLTGDQSVKLVLQ
jgi:hypothetical protein